MSESSLAEHEPQGEWEQQESAVEPQQEEAVPEGKRCKHCGATAKTSTQTVCPKCGYYELLDRVVELDPWDQDDAAVEVQKPVSHLEVWAKLIPPWAWLLGLCVLGVIAESVVARAVTAPRSTLRTMWSLTQLGIGFTTAVTIHFVVFFAAVMDDSSYGLLDVVLRPIRCWMPTLKTLPRTFLRVALGTCGVTAMLASILIIGGIPYSKLWEWGIEAPPEQNLIAAVLDQAKKSKAEEEDLAEAVGSLTKDLEEEDAQLPVEEERIMVQCVIVGFTPSRENPDDFSSLLVASAVGGQLKSGGMVSAGFSNKDREYLNRRLRQILSDQPVLTTSVSAQWVEPKVTCRISCLRRTKSGRLIEPEFEAVINELAFP